MTIWIIEPRDPLIVRDGRPFGPHPGARATSLPFPFPSTTTGGVRTRAGLNDKGIFNLAGKQLEDLKQLPVRGPLLVQLTPDGNDIAQNKWLVPAPLDALLFPAKQSTPSGEKAALLRQLVPLQLPEGAQTDFDSEEQERVQNRLDHEKLMLIGMPRLDLNKPLKEAPHYWNWKFFQNWLLDPSRYEREIMSLATLGQMGPQREQRMHVSIDADREVAKDGMLFETSGLEFTSPGNQHRLKDAQRLALAVAVDDNDDFALRLRNGLACFGGERRIVSWRRSNVDLPLCPAELVEAVVEKKACRIILLTPACFQKGYRPKWLLDEHYGVTPKLKAIATRRPEVVSGWDLAIKKPKPSRRLIPAGTVLFLSLEGGDAAAISNWVEGMWMQCISDEPQDRADGFGLIVLGTWSDDQK